MDDEKAAFIKDCIITIISDDFESFEIIMTDIKSLLSSKGMTATEAEVASLLGAVIGEGYAEAYVLSGSKPYSTRVAYSPDRLEELWYYVTQKGRSAAKGIPELSGEERLFDPAPPLRRNLFRPSPSACAIHVGID